MCCDVMIFHHFQSQEEPDGDGSAADAEFGGHRVLAVMRPPPPPSSQGTVSCSCCLFSSAHTFLITRLAFVELK